MRRLCLTESLERLGSPLPQGAIQGQLRRCEALREWESPILTIFWYAGPPTTMSLPLTGDLTRVTVFLLSPLPSTPAPLPRRPPLNPPARGPMAAVGHSIQHARTQWRANKPQWAHTYHIEGASLSMLLPCMG